VARFVRPQFSLATLLIAMAWSAAVVLVNVEPRIRHWSDWATYGWPSDYAWQVQEFAVPHRFHPGEIISYRALAVDAAVGVLLVAVLTWGSTQLLRRVTSRLRRGRLPSSSPN
jgi:hypothetical protein